MTVRIAQFVHAASDVMDEDFLRDFPKVGEEKGTRTFSLTELVLP